VPGAVTAVALAVVLGGIVVARLVSAAGAGAQPGPRPAQQAAGLQPVGQRAEAGGPPGRAAGGQAGGSRHPGAAGASHRPGVKLAANTGAVGHQLRTSCRAVAHIGDSTSVGMVSAGYLPDPAQRLAAQYTDVGVRYAWIDASGGRSMVEALPGQVNGYDTARRMASAGFRGCWVIALGTNDTANVSAGSAVGRLARVRELMSVAHGAPVLWVNVKTLDQSGPWAESNMLLWNDALAQACHQYPNLRVFDWAAVVRPGWFISDGIHYTSAGYAARAQLIARALARAFPVTGPSTGCLIR
jgi:GDSL-like Lipase/Acylhydrolase family